MYLFYFYSPCVDWTKTNDCTYKLYSLCPNKNAIVGSGTETNAVEKGQKYPYTSCQGPPSKNLSPTCSETVTRRMDGAPL